MSTSAQGIQLQISLEDGVHIKEVHTTRPFEKLNNDRRLDKFLQRFLFFVADTNANVLIKMCINVWFLYIFYSLYLCQKGIII